jgi:hypothetical protein
MQAQQDQQQQQLFALKMAEVKKQQEAEAKRQAMLAQLAQDPRFKDMGPLLQLAPQTALERGFPAPRAPVVVAPGASLVNPQDPQNPMFTAPMKPESSPVARLIQERDALPPGHPSRAVFDAAITKATTNQPLVNVDNRQENAFGKEVGTELGKQYSTLMNADFSAPATIAKYDRLGGLLAQSGSGKFKGATTDIKAAAKGLGIDLTAMGIKDDVDSAQAARALSNQLALELRNPAGGAGMPGAMSDKDREFLLQATPGLENDPNAVGKMIEYRKKLAQREQEVAKMARAYRKKTGKFDEGFYDELQSWSNKNPLFPAPKSTPANGGWSIKAK